VLNVKPLAKFLFVFAFVVSAAAPLAHAQREKLPPEDLEFVQKNWPEAKKTTTGIRYIVLREGSGEPCRPGDRAMVAYVGRLLDGKIFDERDAEHPLAIHVRRGEVIDGWDQILQSMKKGEKRLVIIPSELAYGTRGQPPVIPRNATLVFEMEIVDITRR
jgi:FKBP-type peptidyl-prolyl cis-trans isomerase